MDFEPRIIALEELLSYQDQTISDLNQVILDQHKTIEKLERRLSIVEEKLKEIRISDVTDLSEESPPPHY